MLLPSAIAADLPSRVAAPSASAQSIVDAQVPIVFPPREPLVLVVNRPAPSGVLNYSPSSSSVLSSIPATPRNYPTRSARSNLVRGRKLFSPRTSQNVNRRRRTVRARPIVLPIRSVKRSSACIVCGQLFGEEVPKKALIKFWMEEEVCIPLRSRCCVNHLTSRNVFNEDSTIRLLAEKLKNEVVVTGSEIANFMSMIREHSRSKPHIDYEAPVTDEEYDAFIGHTEKQFNNLLSHIEDDSIVLQALISPQNLLELFMMKMRMNLSQRKLG